MIGVTIREGFTQLFSSSLPSTESIHIHYSRISSNHYSIPSTLSVDQSHSRALFIPRFIALVRSIPPKHEAASTVVLFSHNLSGLLFHLPLLQLVYLHLRDDSQKTDDSLLRGLPLSPSPLASIIPDSDEEGFSFSYLMCLNVVVDLCRLLSRGYGHLYRVFGVIRASMLDTITPIDGKNPLENDFSTNPEDFVPLSLFEYIAQQYALYNTHSVAESHNNHSFLYLRYLQSLQKLVYLMIIDDYLEVRVGRGVSCSTTKPRETRCRSRSGWEDGRRSS